MTFREKTVDDAPLTVEQAAAFIGIHPQTLRERAVHGEIPDAYKPGKAWMFPKEGLILYRQSLCRYTESKEFGTSIYRRPKVDYVALLGLPTRKPRRNSTKNSKPQYGDKNV
jgi:hypothetical protein